MATKRITFGINRREDSKHIIGQPVQGFVAEYPDRPKSWNFFVDMLTDLPWDVGEQAFSHYLIARDLGVPVIALPAFQLRFLPHFGLVVNRNAGIDTPQDLIGKTVGTPDWGFNPAVWLRGILAHQYNVPLERVAWRESEATPLFPGIGYPRSSRYEIETIKPPESVRLSQKDSYGMPLLLDRHELDALSMAGFGTTTQNVARLFSDPLQEARDYVTDAGLIPINTLFVIKEESVERYPDLAPAIMQTIVTASKSYAEEIARGATENDTYVPVKFAQDVDLYPFKQGLPDNRRAVKMMISYCYEQGLIKKLYEPEDLFLKSCL